jgi:hypothetical protein
MPINLTRMLRDALGQLERRRERIAAQIAAVRTALDGHTSSFSSSRPGVSPRRSRARRMSAAERAEVSRRMKAYWAQWRAQHKRKAA